MKTKKSFKTREKSSISSSSITELGPFFKDHRLKKGYSINELVQYADIKSTSALFRFEEGMGDLPLDRIYSLANVLEISPQELMNLLSK